VKGLKNILFIFLLAVRGSLVTAKPSIVKVTDLVKRINNTSDTTYVVNFWATWCPPCVAELPEIDAFGQEHAGTKVKVILVSINYKEDCESKLVPFLEEKRIRSEVMLLDENNFDYFPKAVDARWNGDIPATLILNGAKKYKEIWQQKIDRDFLEEKTKAAMNMSSEHKPAIIKINNLLDRINHSPDTTFVVNFWATWCAPCVQELPEFGKLEEKYAGQKVKVLLVSMDFVEDYEKKLLSFIQTKNIKPEVMLLDEVNANYFIPLLDDRWTGSLPCTLIINRSKNVKDCYEKKVDLPFLVEKLDAALK
jgi:thiol-disulfide isomerase/thioredoxin